MECSIFALIACFSWSGLYLDGGLIYQDSSVPYHYFRDTSPPARDGVVERTAVSTIGHDPRNPYGSFSIGYQLNFHRVIISLEAAHASSLETNEDRGVNAIRLHAKWFPFR